MIDEETLTKCYEAGILNTKGKDMHIENLMHPEKKKLQEELDEINKEDWACYFKDDEDNDCEGRANMKGPWHLCKNVNICSSRISYEGKIGDPIKEVHSST